VNTSFTYPAFNALGSNGIPTSPFYVGGTYYYLDVQEEYYTADNQNFTFYLLYRATLDPTAMQGWTDLIPMVEVKSEAALASIDWPDVTAPVEWAGLWGVAQSVMVTDEDPPRYGFQVN
jgi:hypothetical protein